MLDVTKIMIKQFKIDKLGYDFMGYSLKNNDFYSFHHLIISRNNGGPEDIWNGAILCRKTAHNYLHIIENIDRDMFLYLTSQMIDMNDKGYLDKYNLRKISNALKFFEREHSSDRNRDGKILIKESYTKRNKAIFY